MSRVYLVRVGVLETNCYIIATEKNNAIVIDPGAKADLIIGELKDKELCAKKIIITHAHNDHIGALYELKQATDAKVYIHSADAEALNDPDKNLNAVLHIKNYIPVPADVQVNDSDLITLDEVTLKVMHTPGHTKGSMILIGDDVIFTGDTLFRGECGRTDLYGGSFTQMLDSLRKISKIEGEYVILPGHDQSSTLDDEKKYNRYIRQANNEADF